LRAAVDAAAVREGSGQAGTRAGVLEPPPGAGYMCHYDAFRELERLQNVVGRMHDAGKRTRSSTLWAWNYAENMDDAGVRRVEFVTRIPELRQKKNVELRLPIPQEYVHLKKSRGHVLLSC